MMPRCGRRRRAATRLEYRIPARGLIGYRSQFMTDTPRHRRPLHAVRRRTARRAATSARARTGADRERGGHLERLRPVLPPGARPMFIGPNVHVYERHGRRHPLTRQRPGRQPEQGQEADQHPHDGGRREARARAAAPSSRSSTRSSSSTTTSWSRSRRSRSGCASRSSTTTCASGSRRSRPTSTPERGPTATASPPAAWSAPR